MENKALHKARGCGVPPPSELVDDNGQPVVWDPDRFLESIEEGLSDANIRRLASSHYMYANIGGVMELLGVPWDFCPKWYSQFYRGTETVESDQAINIAVWARKGAAWVVHDTSQPLPPRKARCVNIAWKSLDRLQHEADLRAIEAAKKKDRG